jgi:mRNA interferase MazF
VDIVIPAEGAIAPWDIVRVDFPFSDQAAMRHRPALVIATPAATEAFSILWVLMITSAARERWPLDVAISDLRIGGLSHACVVRTSKVTALDSRLAMRIGELAVVDRAKVAACLSDLLGSVLTG